MVTAVMQYTPGNNQYNFLKPLQPADAMRPYFCTMDTREEDIFPNVPKYRKMKDRDTLFSPPED